jgi:hypothetical protein
VQVTPVDIQQAPPLQAAEDAADRLELEAEEAPDVLARHPQPDVRRRIATRGQALCRLHDECSDSLLCGSAAQQQHRAMVGDDRFAERGVQLTGQALVAGARLDEPRARDDADRRAAERDGVRAVDAGTEPVQAHHVARHGESRHLRCAVLGQHDRLEESGFDDVERLARRPGVVEHAAGVDGASRP